MEGKNTEESDNFDLVLPEIYQKMPQLFKPGQSGNPNGRPPGIINKEKPFATGDISEADLERLDTLSKPKLIALIKKVSGAIWGIALKTEEEAYDAICLKLLNGGLNQGDINKALPALKEYLDRKRGKPIGTAPNINIGTSGNGSMNIEVILVSSEDDKRRQGKLIDES